MGWLNRQVAAAGARLEARRVGSVQELAAFDVVVNCSGEWGGWVDILSGVYGVWGPMASVELAVLMS